LNAIVAADQEETVISSPGSAAPRGRVDQLLKLCGALALLWLLTITFSIAVAETALWLAAGAWGVAWLLRETDTGELGPAAEELGPAVGAPRPAGDLLGLIGAPIIVFFALSLLSALVSRDPVEGFLELKEIFLFAAPLVTWAVFRDAKARARGLEVFAVGVAGALLVGLYQTVTATPAPGDAIYRATGPLGHYMTFSGVLLVAVPALLTIRGRTKRLVAHLVAGSAVGMIGLTLTRSAWIGCGVALIVFFASRFVAPAKIVGGADADVPGQRPAVYAMGAVVALVIIAVFLLALAGPDALYDRAASTFSMENQSNLDRIAMAATGLEIIRAHPWLGIGPGLMGRVYPAWVVDWAVRAENPHLHNNLLQIAAERGLIGLSAWLWMMAAFAILAWRVLRVAGPTGPGGPEARAALAALAGFLTMGMFEYNFSDSEVLMALLFVVSLPLAAAGAGPAASQGGKG
jgi:O-antigen ligase